MYISRPRIIRDMLHQLSVGNGPCPKCGKRHPEKRSSSPSTEYRRPLPTDHTHFWKHLEIGFPCFQQWQRDSFKTLAHQTRDWQVALHRGPSLVLPEGLCQSSPVFAEFKCHQRLRIIYRPTRASWAGTISPPVNAFQPHLATGSPQHHIQTHQNLPLPLLPHLPMPPLQSPPDNNLNVAQVIISFSIKDRIRCW